MRKILARYEDRSGRRGLFSGLLVLVILITSCVYCLVLAGCASRREGGTPTPALQPTPIFTATARHSPTPVLVATNTPALHPSATPTSSSAVADTSTPLPALSPTASKPSLPTATVAAGKPTSTAVATEPLAPTATRTLMATTEPGPSPLPTATPVPTEPLPPTATRTLAPAPTPPVTNPVIRCDPAASTAQPGTRFVIEVKVDNMVDLGGYEFVMTFDPAVVNVQEVTLGSFLGSTGRNATPLGPAIDNRVGRLTFGAFSMGTAAGPGGTGTVAQVTVQAMAAGSSDLTITQAQLTDTLGRLLAPLTMISGSVTVQ